MKRLKNLICANNRIQKIEPELSKYIPHLQTLVLTNNQISELGDLDALESMKELHTLSLMDNPVLGKKHYRLYVIARCPALRYLDFKKVGDKVRRMFFSGCLPSNLDSQLRFILVLYRSEQRRDRCLRAPRARRC